MLHINACLRRKLKLLFLFGLNKVECNGQHAICLLLLQVWERLVVSLALIFNFFLIVAEDMVETLDFSCYMTEVGLVNNFFLFWKKKKKMRHLHMEGLIIYIIHRVVYWTWSEIFDKISIFIICNSNFPSPVNGVRLCISCCCSSCYYCYPYWRK